MKLGGYQIIDLSGMSYDEDNEIFILPSDNGFEKIVKILKSGNKTVLVTGMPAPDNSTITRDFFANVSYDTDDGVITTVYLTSVKWNVSITGYDEGLSIKNVVKIEELNMTTSKIVESEDYDLSANIYIGGETLSIDINESEDTMTISFGGVTKTIE